MQKIKIKNCKKHGMTDFVRESGYWRCKECRIEHVSNRRKNIKKILIDERGGKCSVCHYDKSINALHLYNYESSACIAEFTRNIKDLREEAAKCVVLCSNCRAELN